MSRRNRNRNRNRNTSVNAETISDVITQPNIEDSLEQEEEVLMTDQTQLGDVGQTQPLNPAPQDIQIVEDDLTKKVDVTPASPELKVEEVSPVSPIIPEMVTAAVVTPEPEVVNDEGVSVHVVRLRGILEELKVKLSVRGKKPKDFAEAARLNYTAAKLLQTKPRKDMYDTMLAFFVENRKGVCASSEFLKGSTTLSGNEEQLIGFVFNLFDQLASGRPGPIDSGVIMAKFGGPDIVNYYNAKRKAFKR